MRQLCAYGFLCCEPGFSAWEIWVHASERELGGLTTFGPSFWHALVDEELEFAIA